jgi:hypothetical protein
MLEIKLEELVDIGNSSHPLYLIEAANSCDHNAMAELEHIVAHLLQQWWIFGLFIIYVGKWLWFGFYHALRNIIIERQCCLPLRSPNVRNLAPWWGRCT